MKPRNNSLMFKPEDEGGSGGAAVTDPPAPEGGRNTLMDDLLKERNKRKEAQAERDALQKKLADAEQKDLGEIEQLKVKLTAAEAAVADLTTKSQKAEKAALIRSAAKNFHDPEDAVALLETRGLLTDIEDATDAERAVKALATDRPHLVKDEAGSALGSSMQQILENGLGVAAPAPAGGAPVDDGSVFTIDELKKLSQAEMGELMRTQRDKVDRSLKLAKRS